MATLTIRKIDDNTKLKLRVRAAHHGCSMEEEAREILRASLNEPASQPPENLAEAIRKRFAPFGGVELDLPERGPMREPPDFSE
ncbi:MAG: FitA-like ribbon-helix-helix domain-containing protein [Acidobacteriaceae bacterium]